MGFQGDLRSIDLADLLQSMASRQQSGLLEIMTRDGKWVLSLRDGAIVGLASQPSHDFWSRLVSNGMLTEEQLGEARHAARKQGALAKVLVDKGFVKAERLRSLFVEFIYDELCEVLTLPRGRVEMRENEFLNDRNWAALDLKLSVTKVILESARRFDHWEFVRRYIRGPRVVLVSVSRAQQALEAREGNEIAAAILARVGPDRSIGDIADSLAFTRSEVFREAAELVKHGLLKYANLEDSPKEDPPLPRAAHAAPRASDAPAGAIDMLADEAETPAAVAAPLADATQTPPGEAGTSADATPAQSGPQDDTARIDVDVKCKHKGLHLLTQSTREHEGAEARPETRACAAAPTLNDPVDKELVTAARAAPHKKPTALARHARLACALAAGFLALLVIFGCYEIRARSQFTALTCTLIRDGLDSPAQIDAAIKECMRFRDTYPATFVASFDASALLRELRAKNAGLDSLRSTLPRESSRT